MEAGETGEGRPLGGSSVVRDVVDEVRNGGWGYWLGCGIGRASCGGTVQGVGIGAHRHGRSGRVRLQLCRLFGPDGYSGFRDCGPGCGGVVQFEPGLPKVEALGAVLRELNPSVILRLEQRALDGPSACGLFAGCDIVVEAVDDPEVKKNLVEALLLAGHRVVSASGMAGWGGVPMTARKLGSRLVVVGDHVSGIGPGMPPLAPRVVMAAAMEADAVLEMLLGECR